MTHWFTHNYAAIFYAGSRDIIFNARFDRWVLYRHSCKPPEKVVDVYTIGQGFFMIIQLDLSQSKTLKESATQSGYNLVMLN